ncbi:MAG: sulfite reductase subunit alpha [Paludisphaera borealis]|uniref:sulfite reductase subunit alpha n=1 Tax=Paludisphaera borealis TaxID=1387353 RepID=UPI00284ADC88|nr:sulfite reductase subunit alpha [Paludisphaera borealis]MDR3621912.1 sulfite reductase subunit alpha [Paludisphaera borealis]
MTVPVLPESAPFTPMQRAWLNGFFAGMLNVDSAPIDSFAAPSISVAAEPVVVEDFPWHDPALALDERLKLADGRPPERVMMAAMAQLDCGACGYLCKTYAEAVFGGEESDLTKCTPGGRETARKLKELVAARKSSPVKTNGSVAVVDKSSHGRANPFRAPLLRSESLNRPGSAKDVRMVAFSLKGSGLSYEVGDALGVFPENDPELVEAIIKAMGARGDEWVPIPGGSCIHLYEALTNHYVITKVGDDFAALMAAHATSESEAATLRTLVEDDADGIPAHWDVLDVLEQFPSARPPLGEMVGALPSLQPRLYSISSSLKAFPDEVHLTVGVVRYEQGGRRRRGVASNFLAETLRPRLKASVFVHTSPGFRLPADDGAPVVMIGPGTGVAPFRAFLQDRASSGAKGRNWLFFGDQRSETDYLYRDEIETYRAVGLLTRLDLAFSRDQAEKVYVQHKMRESAAELWSWLEAGAHFYVCGDARKMALDVDFALREIVAEKGRMSADAAKEYLKTMSQSGRYQRDVY